MTDAERIPVTVVGGFLGAGKTTLVNHLLRTATRRYAVLVNDFGSVNVDAGLIRGQDGDVLALANGCVCCSIGPDLGDSLGLLARRRPAPDHIIVEASGVSDPWRVAQIVKLEAGVMLDTVLVLADAAAFPAQLADRYLTDTLERQLARADLVVLTKCDLAGPAKHAAADAVLRVRPDARVVEMDGAALPEALLGGIATAPGVPSRLVADSPRHDFPTWQWQDPAPFDAARLGAVLDGLPPSVLRLKGICRVGPDGTPHLLQLTGRRWSLAPADAAAEAGPLVLIGTAALPPADQLAALFRTALLPHGDGTPVLHRGKLHDCNADGRS